MDGCAKQGQEKGLEGRKTLLNFCMTLTNQQVDNSDSVSALARHVMLT